MAAWKWDLFKDFYKKRIWNKEKTLPVFENNPPDVLAPAFIEVALLRHLLPFYDHNTF